MLDCYFTEVLDHQPGYGPTEWCFIVKTKDEWESGSDNFVHLAFKFPDGTECITKPLYDPAINNFCGPPACPGGYRHTYCGYVMPPNPLNPLNPLNRFLFCEWTCSHYPPFCGPK